MEPRLQTEQLSARDAGHILRALERLEILLTTAEAARMIPVHHRLMAEARGLCAAVGIRVMRLGGGASVVKDEWRRPSRPDEGICHAHVGPDELGTIRSSLLGEPEVVSDGRTT